MGIPTNIKTLPDSQNGKYDGLSLNKDKPGLHPCSDATPVLLAL